MKTLDLKQGEASWLAYRATARNASDAAAAMGIHPTKTRLQLLDERKTGLDKEHSRYTEEVVFAGGHRVEGVARVVAEAITGEDLYPVVGSEVVDGIELSASFDGLSMGEDLNWECKSLNEEMRAALRMPGPDGNDARNLPKYHRVQMEQQCAVAGCARVLFTASDGKDDHRHCWYTPDAALRREVIAGWRQFDIDLAEHQPTAAAAPAPTGRAPDSLPALFITVKGEVTASNLAEFKTTALAAIRSVNRELNTDTDFADADKAVKWCSDVEDRLAAAKQHALSQTASIDELFRVMDEINAEARQTRLDLAKLITARKSSRKQELLATAQAKLTDHLRALNARLGRDYMPQALADFAGAINGKRNFDSMAAALDATLANAKIASNETADRIQTNLNTLRELAVDHKFLFADTPAIVLKAPDDCRALIENRIAAHKAEEARKQEVLRESIRAEEQAKAEKAVRDQAEADAQKAREAEAAAAKAATPEPEPVAPAPAHVPAPAAKVVVPMQPARPSCRAELNAHLDRLNDADLQRVLSFVKSRYGVEQAA